MIEIKNIRFSYDREIVKDVSFSVQKGKVLGIVGKSGGGKSSLLKIIGGYLTADSGEVHFKGKKLKRPVEILVPGYKEISLVHQDFGLDLYHTVRENIKEKVLHLPLKFQNQLIQEMMDLLDLWTIEKQNAIDLSGGEQQRLSLARALVSETELILLDEPFVHLDTPMRRKVIHYLESLKEIRGTSFIIVTHNGEEVLSLCDEVIYLKNGQIKRKGVPERFYDSPKSIEEAEFFGPINSVWIEGKRKLFRPNQFCLNHDANQSLELTFQKARKSGAYWSNYFKTGRGEDVLLFTFEPFKTDIKIYV
ncbi:MAG: ABC transporter ATP-binding protein [Crocinitomicaceae bacterium]